MRESPSSPTAARVSSPSLWSMTISSSPGEAPTKSDRKARTSAAGRFRVQTSAATASAIERNLSRLAARRYKVEEPARVFAQLEALDRVGPAGLAHPRSGHRAPRQVVERVAQRVRVVALDQMAGDAFFDHVRDTADLGGDDGQPSGQRLHAHQRVAVGSRR